MTGVQTCALPISADSVAFTATERATTSVALAPRPLAIGPILLEKFALFQLFR